MALIPARGGSKRLPGKNVRSLGGRPLIVWSIEAALAQADICDVLVSTDDDEIGRIASIAGAMVPWLRPPELANDTASSLDVTLHALDWYEDRHGVVDGVLLMQPTSPFRSDKSMAEGISMFHANGGRAVIGVVPAATHPMWAMKIEDGELKPFMAAGWLKLRSQDLPPAFAITGSFYLVSPRDLRSQRTLFPAGALPLHVDQRESVDIDTLEDFELAEALWSIGHPGGQ